MLKKTPVTCNLRMITKSDSLRQWQAVWDAPETGRFAHSITPKIVNRAWFEGHNDEQNFVRTNSIGLCQGTQPHIHISTDFK
jgi:hypothetical protein